jgi:uncharacterized membrane protein YoaK (UPF0700 family)
MKRTKFGVAQLVLHLSSILQVVAALMAATVVAPLGFAPQASTTQRVSTTNIVAAKILYFTVEHVSQARCLNRCTGLVWRIASGIFLINTGVAALATGAQPKLRPVLTCGVAIAGKISVWNGRELV